MNGSRMENWREVWERKGREACNLTLEELISLDGFDKGLGKMSEDEWLKVCHIVSERLELNAGDHLLEVGCGSGAMLLPLSKMNIKVAGIDYSESLVDIALQAMPGTEIRVSEAKDIPFGGKTFSKILSHSVFHYFPDIDYAIEVLLEMLRVLRPEGKILVMDIPDLSKKDKCEQTRRQAHSQDGVNSVEDSSFSHLYYPKSFFTSFAEAQGINLDIFDQEMQGYGNSPFRFNVLLWR